MKTRDMRFRDVSPIVCAAFYEACGSPLLGPALLDEHEKLVSAPFPEYQGDVAEFRDAYWASESWSKYPYFDLGIDREAAAYEKFLVAEDQCRISNERLVDWYMRPGVSRPLFARARRLVAHVLGRFNPDEVIRYCSFGPGATTSMRRSVATQQRKWEFAAHITEECLPWYLAYRKYNSGWHIGDRKIEIVEGNRVTTVPKNAKTDRVIAVEPDWNMFFQRGIGGVIRQRLNRRLRLLLPNSQEHNREAAQRGSASGDLATLDLSMASDSISLALAEALLPEDWFRACFQTRSHKGSLQGRTITYEKISSMGNGYTFELETLIIWALSQACCNTGSVLVYGDDIICPRESAERVCSALSMAGFVINTKKSHLSGPFRESCGGHYLLGNDVTPPYFKRKIDNVLEAIRTCNRLTRCCSQQYPWLRDGRFQYIWDFLAKRIPKAFRGPMGMSDGVLWTSFDEARPEWDFHLQQWRVKTLLPVNKDGRCDSWGGVFTSLYGRIGGGETFGYTDESRLRVAKTLATTWSGPGPWLDWS